MKKIGFLLVMIAGLLSFTSSIKAQNGSAALFPLIAGDTLVTSGSKDSVSKTINVTDGYASLGIQVVTTKLSSGGGTIVGKAYLYRSMDNVNYVVTDSSAAFLNQTTNVAQFEKFDPSFTFYKVQVREPDGANNTQGNIVRVYYTLRRYSKK